MSLQLGSLTTVVISSVDLAKDLFLNHDLSFSSRIITDASQAMSHYKFSIAWLPVSPKWRSLRKICAVQLFTKKSLGATELLRQEKVQELIEYVGECCRNGQTVEIGGAIFTTLLNLLSNTFFSIDLVSHSSAAVSQEFKDVVWALMETNGKPNLADFFPILGCCDLLGVRRNAEAYFRKFFAIFDDIIEKKLSGDHSSDNDVLATLLKINQEEDSDLSLDDIKHLLIDLFVAGTDTTSSTLEWAMTELLRNPTKLVKAQVELEEILGKDGLIRESDIGRLPYLQAVVKETLRLHPPASFLIPRKAENDVDFRGYIVPKNSQVLVNVWATNRDPSAWQDPTNFFPERFLGSKIDFKGQHFELLPFGSGRRVCPGLSLAYRMLHLILANLLHCFNWKLENGMTEEDVDMTELFGLSLHKAMPLFAVPVAK